MKAVRFRSKDAALRLGVQEKTILHFIEEQWIIPTDPQKPLDIEDLARAQLIRELQEDFGVNEEAIPIILRLIDQVLFLEAELQKKRSI